MKKIILFVLIISSTSCGTIFGGFKGCKQKPAAGEEKRAIRTPAVFGDVLTPMCIEAFLQYKMFALPLVNPGLIVVMLGIDFLSGEIYKPCLKKSSTVLK